MALILPSNYLIQKKFLQIELSANIDETRAEVSELADVTIEFS